MTEFILTATRFDQVVERDDAGRPLVIVKHRRGDVVSGLPESEIDRLVRAGAIAPREASVDDPEDDASDVDDVADEGGAESEAAGLDVPKQTAAKEAWVEYAVAKGYSREDAEVASKAELVKALS